MIKPGLVLTLLSGACSAIPFSEFQARRRNTILETRAPNNTNGSSTPSFYAVGDSYSAGPGAGEEFDDGESHGTECFRSNGSYPVQLWEDHPKPLALGRKFKFLSCSGDVTADVVKYQVPKIKYEDPNADTTVTLSIGGNDVGFFTILKTCLVGLGSDEECQTAKDKATDLLNNADGTDTFRNSLYAVWDGLFIPDPSGPTYQPNIKHTLYPRFFNADTDVCDDTNIFIGEIIPGAPKLTKEVRQEMNDLTDLLNSKITDLAQDFSTSADHQYAEGRLSAVDPNPNWEGHRLCEEFVTDDPPGFDNDDVWLFGVAGPDSPDSDVASDGGHRSHAPKLDEYDPKTCDPDHGDFGRAVGCELARKNAASDDDLFADLDLDTPAFITKFFHPKSAGHAATEQAIIDDEAARRLR